MDVNTTFGNVPTSERPISHADENWEALPQRLRGRGDFMLTRGRIKDAELMFDAATEIENMRSRIAA